MIHFLLVRMIFSCRSQSRFIDVNLYVNEYLARDSYSTHLQNLIRDYAQRKNFLVWAVSHLGLIFLTFELDIKFIQLGIQFSTICIFVAVIVQSNPSLISPGAQYLHRTAAALYIHPPLLLCPDKYINIFPPPHPAHHKALTLYF